MPLETATYITDLVATNPSSSDPLSNADDHMRLIKSALKTTFPNFTSAALNSTQANLDGAATQYARNGDVPAGAIMDFGMATAPTGWLVCDGQSVLRTDYPALFAAIGTTWGAVDGTHFTIPPMTTRFRRHRDSNPSFANTVGTLQNPQNLSHVHNQQGTFTSGGFNNSIDHLHAFSGTTGTDSPDHAHGYTAGDSNGITYAPNAGAFHGVAGSASNTGGATARHAHGFSGTTGAADRDLNHTHNVTISGATSTGSADGAEVRPYCATVLTCIKT